MFDDIPRPTCRSVYTVSDKHLRHGGSGYETNPYACRYRHVHCMMTDVVMTDLNMPLAVQLHGCTLVCVR